MSRNGTKHQRATPTLTLMWADEQRTVSALAMTLKIRDAETQGHSERVVRFSLLLGHELGLNESQLKSLEYGSLLHDIGKIGVPDAILLKPGPLTSTEWLKMREHPLLGMNILTGIDFLKEASFVVGQHHERWDGKGYPFGLRQGEIDCNARIFAVADAFDAMTTQRVYNTSKSFAAALVELRRGAGQQFDPHAVEAFAAIPQQRLLGEIEAMTSGMLPPSCETPGIPLDDR